MEVSSGKLRRMQEKIVVIYDDQKYCIGHGVLINHDGLILTVFHLFESKTIGSKVLVKGNGGIDPQVYVAKIVGLDKTLDLALLQIKVTNFKYAKIAKEVRFGQGVHMIVSDDGEIFSYTGGIVAFDRRQRQHLSGTHKIRFIAPETIFVQVHGLHGQPGCSGAPIFDSRGHIVGIYSCGYLRMDLLVHLEHLQTFSQLFNQGMEKVEEEEENENVKKKKKGKIENIDVQSETSEAGEKKKRKKKN